MECPCSVNNWRDGDETHYREKKLRAAKQHTCIECEQDINKGEEFMFCSILGDRSIHNYNMCLDCHAVIDVFFPDGWTFASVWNDLYIYFDESWQDDLPSDCLSKLPPKAREAVCNLLQEYQES